MPMTASASFYTCPDRPAPPRLMPDPPPYRGAGILTRSELAAVIRVLIAVESRPGALVVTTCPTEDQDASIALGRAQYIRAEAAARGSFRWARLELTPSGAAYLAQMLALS